MPAEMERRAEESHHLDEGWYEAVHNLIELTGITDKELIDHSLEAVIRLTGSRIGYLHFVSEDQEHLELFTWSQAALKVCTSDKASHYPLSQAFIWADCLRTGEPVIHNDNKNPSDKTGYPEEHNHIVRHMSVPITDDEKIVAIVGVGNKEEPYDQSDVRHLSLFMNSMWSILKRKRMQEKTEQLVSELQQALADSKTLRGLLPICSNCKRIRDDQGQWNQLESYIQEHSDADFTHGICPECTRQLYPYVNVDL